MAEATVSSRLERLQAMRDAAQSRINDIAENGVNASDNNGGVQIESITAVSEAKSESAI